jgi:hypothetical protein
LQSMQEAAVALRSAELLREGLEIARSSGQHDAFSSIPPAESSTDRPNDGLQGRRDINDSGTNSNHYIPQNTFVPNGYGADPAPLFASLIDPGLLQDFTTGLNPFADMDTSAFLFDGFYNDGQNFDSTPPLYNGFQ